MKKFIKDLIVVLFILVIIFSTVVPIVLEWNGLWNTAAGLEARSAVFVSDTILYSEDKGISEKYRDKLIEMLKE